MLSFVHDKLSIGHNSPLQQLQFDFGLSGVSRVLSHQLVRHHNGIDFEQQSQRYVTFKGGKFPYTIPETWTKAGLQAQYKMFMRLVARTYDEAIKAGIPAEDARFVLPNATQTNLKVTVNFLEFQHIADERLCTRAQWEFRKLWAMMRAEVNRAAPWLAKLVGPKCQAYRLGYCNEQFKDWEACPLGKIRPHKSQVIPV